MTHPASPGRSVAALTASLPPTRRWQPAARRLLLAILPACLLAGAASLAAQQAGGQGRVALRDSFREVAAPGAAPDASHAELARDTLTADESAESHDISVSLKMRNFQEMERRVAAGETIPRAEMAARYLPDAKDYEAVANWLASQGLTVTSKDGASHTLVTATGTSAQLQQAFQTRFARVRFRGDEYTAAVAAPSVPADIGPRVRAIHGLQPYLHPRKRLIRRKPEVLTSNGQPPYLVSDILKAYGINTGNLTGAGQQIGIVIDTVPTDSDLTLFWSNNGINQSVSNVIIVKTTTHAVTPPTGEETLDVAWSSGIASGAQIVVYACGDLNYVDSDYSQILDDVQSGTRPNLHQISMSFGGGETSDETSDDMNSTHAMFTALAASGVSLFAASGDDGPYGDGGEPVQVLYPASDPLVTGVGATSLYLNASTGAVSSETVWTAVPDTSKGADTGSSGGGISQFWPRPSWQTSAGANSPGSFRLVPDVAFAGDPNTGCYLIFKGKEEQDGGTSWGTPCWAAMCALINEYRANQGLPALNGMNPQLYPLLGSTSFRDITTGNNYLYYAGAGFDLVTGIGAPVFNNLLLSLSHPAFFNGETALSSGVYYLMLASGSPFGYYSYLTDQSYIYHFDLGYEYLFNANDGASGVYLYDFLSNDFFYTSPSFPFPYLYDFGLNATLYYYSDPNNAGHYTTNPRYFFNFATGQIITK